MARLRRASRICWWPMAASPGWAGACQSPPTGRWRGWTYAPLSGARAGGSAGPHHWRWWRGGFGFRTPELAAREALSAGVTTLVAALGTDSLTRSPAQVLGKVREFRAAGVSAFMYTGSYHLPVKTLTGTVESDIMLIPEVLGVGRWPSATTDPVRRPTTSWPGW